ncbi:MAG: Hsp70 family protein, partial [Hydrogenoanaerobacterium sp.]
DANGIVHVSAKDLGTGKEQHITITSSTNMSKDEVESAVKNAEAFAAEDKKRRDEIDARNSADQLVYQSEKSITDLGDKIDPAEKTDLEGKIAALKEALKGTDAAAIKAKQDELQKKFYEVSSKVYEQTAQQPQPDAAPQGDAADSSTD